MRRFLRPGCIWSALGAIALKVLLVLLLINCFQAAKAASTLTQSYWGPGGSPVEEASRFSQMLDDECTQQAKRACASEQPCFSSALPQWRDRGPWQIMALCVPPRPFILPRKLSPPTHPPDDDPFLL